MRIVDVIGTINSSYCSYDSQGNRINDPYPTDFESGGFDLDGVAVMNENNIYASTESFLVDKKFEVYPNPSKGIITMDFLGDENTPVGIFNFAGSLIWQGTATPGEQIDLTNYFKPGIYFVRLSDDSRSAQKLLIVE